MKQLVNCFILLLLTTHINAQADSSKTGSQTVFKIGTFYISHLNYYGRTDSMRSSGFFPLAEIWFNKKFYINAAPVFVSNKTSGTDYAGSIATIGYQARSKNQKFFSHTYIVKPFYKSESELPQSVLKAQASTALAFQNKILNLNAGADLRLSDKMDYGLNAGIDHVFKKQFSKKTILVLDPSAYVYAGTQQFTKTYYKKSSLLLFPGAEQQVTEDVNKLSILSYEFSMPVILAVNNIQLIINPAYVIPQNLIKVENRPDLSERGKEMLYLTAGLKYSF